MHPFLYVREAHDPGRACRLVGEDPRATFLAGGTSLVDLMRLDVETPETVVDVNRLPMDKIDDLGGGLRIGANVRNSDLAHDDRVRKQFPVLSEAILSGASPQLRNMATTAGNLLQRTRCPYFRDGYSPCNKRQPGSGCAALDGFNRSHAVLGTSDKCIAAHPSDMAVALVALDAQVHTRLPGHGGERVIPLHSFYVSYGDDPARENVLEHGELITAVEVKAQAVRSHYLKVRDRVSYAFALASAAVVVAVDGGGAITYASIALGGVATAPWQATAAEVMLIGERPNAAVFRAAADAALKDARPRQHNTFKVELAKRTLVRALQTVTA